MNNQDFDRFLVDQGLKTLREVAAYSPLTGGVSSDIYRVDLPGRSLCIKRALPKLKVAADWRAPVSRSSFEWEWISFVSRHFPEAVPRPLAHDAASGIFAMAFLRGKEYPLWKTQLLAGDIDDRVAKMTGRLIGKIHAISAQEPGLPRRFDSGDNFYALRLAPYLVATAEKHPPIAFQLDELVARTASTKKALVHGDVSPKNILTGPHGPVLLDAECAWFGDPAFDLAFCLNHLLLKKLVTQGKRLELKRSFEALSAAYLSEVNWESAAELERRAASLLPALFLARVDGKSPVEYVTDNLQREAVRKCAIPLIRTPPGTLDEAGDAWFQE